MNDKPVGLVVIDKRYATVGVWQNDKIEALKHFSSVVSGGGFGKGTRLPPVRKYYERVGSSASKAFCDLGIDDVIVGGPSPTKEEFVAGSFLDSRLKIVRMVDVTYTDESGLYELVEMVKSLIDR